MDPRDRLPEGKVPWDLLETLVGGALPEEVLLGPAAGEDAALVRLGGEVWAVASDPISFTAREAGRLAVVVNANDVATRGARPALFLAVILLAPGEATPGRVGELLGQIRRACDELEVALIGGHTEVAPGLGHSVVVGTMLGPVEGRVLTTAGVRPGDRIGMTKWAGLEGTAILLAEKGEQLARELGPETLRPPDELASGAWLSVVPEAAVARRHPAVSALHDVTEGGVGEALFEMARASGLALEVAPEAVPVLPQTRRICGVLGIDPLGLIGSGALLIACGEEGAAGLERDLARAGIPFAWIGRAGPRGSGPPRPGPAGGIPRFERDELLKVDWLRGVEAVLFDMDGTLVDTGYDWPAIRRTLDVPPDSTIIDHLNGLGSPHREDGWATLHAIEREATGRARPREGAAELLGLLRERGLKTALVTNNSAANTRTILERFGFSFDAVLTRDDGFWKPSGQPLAEAARRLGVPPDRCVAVGDSDYDVQAGREAGCARVCLVHGGQTQLRAGVDLRFDDLPALIRCLRITG